MGPRDVVCLNCNAQPGKPCTQPTDTGRREVAWYHFERLRALDAENARRTEHGQGGSS